MTIHVLVMELVPLIIQRKKLIMSKHAHMVVKTMNAKVNQEITDFLSVHIGDGI